MLSIAEAAKRLNTSSRVVADVLRLNSAPGVRIYRVDGYRRVDGSDLKAIRKAINRIQNNAPKSSTGSALSRQTWIMTGTHGRRKVALSTRH